MNKKQYTAPELTVVTFKSERGFAQSGLSATKFRLNSLLGLYTPSIESGQETWSAQEDLFSDDWDVSIL